MKKLILLLTLIPCFAFGQAVGPPSGYPKVTGSSLSDTALFLVQIPPYLGGASIKMRSITTDQLARRIAEDIDTLAVTCNAGLNCDSTGHGDLARQNSATLKDGTRFLSIFNGTRLNGGITMGLGNNPSALISLQDSIYGNYTDIGGYHGFDDKSRVNMVGTFNAYASLSLTPVVTGSSRYDHFTAAQVWPYYESSGNIGTISGVDVYPAQNGAGVDTNLYGVRIRAPAGTGTILNYKGLFLPSGRGGTLSNYNIYAEGDIPSFINGSLGVGSGAGGVTEGVYVKGGGVELGTTGKYFMAGPSQSKFGGCDGIAGGSGLNTCVTSYSSGQLFLGVGTAFPLKAMGTGISLGLGSTPDAAAVMIMGSTGLGLTGVDQTGIYQSIALAGTASNVGINLGIGVSAGVTATNAIGINIRDFSFYPGASAALVAGINIDNISASGAYAIKTGVGKNYLGDDLEVNGEVSAADGTFSNAVYLDYLVGGGSDGPLCLDHATGKIYTGTLAAGLVTCGGI